MLKYPNFEDFFILIYEEKIRFLYIVVSAPRTADVQSNEVFFHWNAKLLDLDRKFDW